MQNVNESSSESNIIVTGIVKFSQTPHSINKMAYKFKMGKDAQNRPRFNLNQLPEGAYTFVVEFLTPTFNNVSVDCRSTLINVNNQISKPFPGYQKKLLIFISGKSPRLSTSWLISSVKERVLLQLKEKVI